MKKLLILLCLSLLILTACSKKDDDGNKEPQGCDIIDDCTPDEKGDDAMTFKEKYEFFNGVVYDDGEVVRTISIPEDHPFIKTSGQDIINRIENKETFYLYIGDEQCPWCRSVIEKAIEVAKQHNIDTIYYIEVWDADFNEIFRDRYRYEDNQVKKLSDGDPTYPKFLELFDEFLDDYTLFDGENDIEVGEKRIYVPAYFYIENGVAKKYTTGTSPLQSESGMELTEEMLKDETDMFNEFFNN